MKTNLTKDQKKCIQNYIEKRKLIDNTHCFLVNFAKEIQLSMEKQVSLQDCYALVLQTVKKAF